MVAGLLALAAIGAPGQLPAQSPATLLAQAEAQFRAHHLDSAAILLRRVVDSATGATADERVNAWVRLGVVQYSAGDSTGAADAFRSAFAIDTGLEVSGLARIDSVLGVMFQEQKAEQVLRLAAQAPLPDSVAARVFECARRCPDGARKPRLTAQPRINAVFLPAGELGPARGDRAFIVIRVVIDPNGAPETGSYRVLSSTAPAYNALAIEAVHATRFIPGMYEGHPVRAAVELRFEFRAEGLDRLRYTVSGP
jgi:TonB family protein